MEKCREEMNLSLVERAQYISFWVVRSKEHGCLDFDKIKRYRYHQCQLLNPIKTHTSGVDDGCRLSIYGQALLSQQLDKSTPQALGCEDPTRINGLLNTLEPVHIFITITREYGVGLRSGCIVDVLIPVRNTQVLSRGIQPLNDICRHPVHGSVVGAVRPCRRDKNHFTRRQQIHSCKQIIRRRSRHTKERTILVDSKSISTSLFHSRNGISLDRIGNEVRYQARNVLDSFHLFFKDFEALRQQRARW